MVGWGEMVGAIDDVRIFNRALSGSEVASLWRFQHKLLASSSVAYDDMSANPAWGNYQFTGVTSYDEVSIPRSFFVDMETKKLSAVTGKFNDLIEDLSGNGNNLENFGATVSTGATNCKVGACYLFNETGSYMEVKSTESLNIWKELSASAWVKVDTAGPTTQTRLDRSPGKGTKVNGPLSVWNSVEVPSCGRAWQKFKVSAACG